MSADLEAAFRATDYVVLLDGLRVILTLDQPSTALADWLATRGLREFSVITAWNPGARLAPDAVNQAAQAALLVDLEAGGWSPVPGRNHAQAGGWPDEAAYFVPGMSLADAIQIGAKYGQRAIVHGDATGVPRLIWIEKQGK